VTDLSLEIRRAVDSVMEGEDSDIPARFLVDLSRGTDRDQALRLFELCDFSPTAARLLADGFHVETSDLLERKVGKKEREARARAGRIRLLRILFGLGVLKKKGNKVVRVKDPKAIAKAKSVVAKFKSRKTGSKAKAKAEVRRGSGSKAKAKAEVRRGSGSKAKAKVRRGSGSRDEGAGESVADSLKTAAATIRANIDKGKGYA
jgi:hypothetical protein